MCLLFTRCLLDLSTNLVFTVYCDRMAHDFGSELQIEQCLDLGGVFGFEASFFTFEEADPHFGPSELLPKFLLRPAFGFSGSFDNRAADSNGRLAAWRTARSSGVGF